MRFPCLLLCAVTWALPAVESLPPAELLPTVAVAPVQAQVPDDPVHAFLLTLAQAPQVRALLEQRQAMRHLEGAAGRLPDPMLALGYARKRTPMEHMPMYDVMLEQPLPRWGERDAARAMAASATRMSEAEIAAEVAMLAGEITTALAELDGLRAQVTEGEAQEQRIAALAHAMTNCGRHSN